MLVVAVEWHRIGCDTKLENDLFTVWLPLKSLSAVVKWSKLNSIRFDFSIFIHLIRYSIDLQKLKTR